MTTTKWTAEYIREYNRQYRAANRDKLREQHRAWKQSRPAQNKLLNKQERWRLKLDVLTAYSVADVPVCAHCGYANDVRALQLDHINNDGADSRRALSGVRTAAGSSYYRWLRKNDYPPGYQVLCANCNIIKFYDNINAYYPTAAQL